MTQLQALYDSEINFDLSTFWDNGFEWRLGDVQNGWKERGSAASMEEAVKALSEAAFRHYPESVFAKAMARDKTVGAPGPPYCCEQDCPNDAEFEVYYDHPDIPSHDGYTHACAGHVGEMCGSPADGPVVTAWRIVPLPSQVSA